MINKIIKSSKDQIDTQISIQVDRSIWLLANRLSLQNYFKTWDQADNQVYGNVWNQVWPLFNQICLQIRGQVNKDVK